MEPSNMAMLSGMLESWDNLLLQCGLLLAWAIREYLHTRQQARLREELEDKHHEAESLREGFQAINSEPPVIIPRKTRTKPTTEREFPQL